MKSNEIIRDMLGWGAILFGIFMLALILVTTSSWLGYKNEIIECKDYYDYGYMTEVKGDFWYYFMNGGKICLIIMEDGTKLPLDDYKIMSIKNAKIR